MIAVTTQLPLFFHTLFYCAVIYTASYSLFMLLHWFMFGMNRHIASTAAVIYIAGVAACFLLMSIALLGI